jgi:hypothetical protein
LEASVAVAEEPTRIQTDRPSVSNSTSTVPPGALQIEGGVDYSVSRVSGGSDERQFQLGAMLRAGLTDRLEVRLDGAPLVRLRGAEDDTGFGAAPFPRRGRRDLVRRTGARLRVPRRGERAARAVTGVAACPTS